MKADMKKNEEIIEALANRNQVSKNWWLNKPFYILTGASDWDCSSGNGRQDWSSWLLWDVRQGERGGEGALWRGSSACLDQARRKKERFLRLLYHCIKIAVEKQQNKQSFPVLLTSHGWHDFLLLSLLNSGVLEKLSASFTKTLLVTDQCIMHYGEEVIGNRK